MDDPKYNDPKQLGEIMARIRALAAHRDKNLELRRTAQAGTQQSLVSGGNWQFAALPAQAPLSPAATRRLDAWADRIIALVEGGLPKESGFLENFLADLSLDLDLDRRNQELDYLATPRRACCPTSRPCRNALA